MRSIEDTFAKIMRHVMRAYKYGVRIGGITYGNVCMISDYLK